MVKRMIVVCLCLGCALMFTITNTSANENDPGATPAPACSGPYCWVIE